MWSSEKRRARELEKRNERLYYKFIYEYTKCLHPDVYTEATNMYRNIRELYPKQVKDITKTVEFMAATKQENIPRYYYHRKTINPHSDTSNTREMVLEIPLMTPSEIPQSISQPPLLLEQSVFEGLLKEIQNDPDLNRILNDFPGDVPPDAGTPDMDLNSILNDFPGDVPPDAGTPDMDLNSILNDFPGDVPPDAGTPDMDLNQILSGLLKEIQNDPGLNRILNDFPGDVPPDDDDTPAEWNDDDVMGLTPLEQELCLY